jgi:hypothetical protein
VYFATYAFRSENLDETIPKEFEYRIRYTDRFDIKDEKTFEYVVKKANTALKFLEKALLPLSKKHRNARVIAEYHGEPLKDIVGKKFWYAHYGIKDKQRIVTAYIDDVWRCSKEGQTLQDANVKIPSLYKMRRLFPAVEEVIREQKDEKVYAREKRIQDLVAKVKILSNKELFQSQLVENLGLPQEQHYYALVNGVRETRLKGMSEKEIVELYKTLPHLNPLVCSWQKGSNDMRRTIDRSFMYIIRHSNAYTKRKQMGFYTLRDAIASETDLGPSLVGRMLERKA